MLDLETQCLNFSSLGFRGINSLIKPVVACLSLNWKYSSSSVGLEHCLSAYQLYKGEKKMSMLASMQLLK